MHFTLQLYPTALMWLDMRIIWNYTTHAYIYLFLKRKNGITSMTRFLI